MWNCNRIGVDGRMQLVKDVVVRFQKGSEDDRLSTSSCDLAHLKTKEGASLGTLAIGDLTGILEFNDTGFAIQGGLVETADNGYITKRLRIFETWDLSVSPE